MTKGGRIYFVKNERNCDQDEDRCLCGNPADMLMIASASGGLIALGIGARGIRLMQSNSCDPTTQPGSWVGTTFPADAARQAAPHAVNRHERPDGIAKRK